MKSFSKFIHFHSRKCIWKCRLENGGYFVSASMCYCFTPAFVIQCFATMHFLACYLVDHITSKLHPENQSNKIDLISYIRIANCHLNPYSVSTITFAITGVVDGLDLCVVRSSVAMLLVLYYKQVLRFHWKKSASTHDVSKSSNYTKVCVSLIQFSELKKLPHPDCIYV